MRSPNELKKGAWTRDEDQKLIAYISRYGIWNWSQMPKFAGLARSGKSCRLRWMNYLRPDIKLGNFTEEEDETIINLHTIHGNRWSTIATKLPGRTDNEVKNRWHTHLKKRLNRTQMPTVSTQEREYGETTTNCHGGFENAVESNISIFDYDLSMTQYMQAEEENSLSSSTETAGGDDISTSGSEETLSDLQSFWRQLYSLETLKMQNHNEAIAELGLNLERNDEHDDFWFDLSCIL